MCWSSAVFLKLGSLVDEKIAHSETRRPDMEIGTYGGENTRSGRFRVIDYKPESRTAQQGRAA
jgi:hypothetical protein